jgi:hypothetical protein
MPLIYFLFYNCLKQVSKEDISTTNFFEGKVTYELSYLLKTNNVTKEQADLVFGNKQTYFPKGNMYKNEMNGTLKMSQYYLGKDTLYISTNNSDNLLWVDATYLNDEIISIELTEGVEKINGILCDLLTIKSNNGYFKYLNPRSIKKLITKNLKQ